MIEGILEAAIGQPIEQPVLVFAIALTAFLIAPLVIKKLGQPGIVGIVLAGALIGPNALGVVEHTDAIVLLGEVGLVYLLFTVGLELDLRGFSKAPEDAALFGLMSFGLPLIAGTVVGIFVLGLGEWGALLLAAVFASHTLIAYPIVNRLDITKNRAVTAVFGGILFTDTLALVVLAIVLGAVEGGLTLLLFGQIFVSLLVLFAGVWFVIPPVARWFFQNLSEESYYEFLFVVAVVFIAAGVAEILDIAPILGAFVAGIALNRLISRGGPLMNRIEFMGNAFFIPFFLLHVGMLVDVGVILDGIRTIEVAVVIITVMVLMKAAAAWGVSAIQGYEPNERGVVFGLSTGQAAAALAITLIGFDEGLFGADILNAVVLMLLVTAVVSPWLTERYGTRLTMGSEAEIEQKDVSDPRLLLPLSTHAEFRRRLLEFGFVLKDEYAEEPVHLVTVARPGSNIEMEQQLAGIEGDLEEVAEFGDAAEVPVEIETRLNHNIASGIVQTSVETRADIIVMGWDAAKSFGSRMFGSIIDQVLQRTNLPVLISRLGHPINTTRKLFVVLPSGIDHHEGFYEAVHIVKRLADKLGAPMTVLVVNDSVRTYEQLFALVEIELEAEFEGVDSYDELLAELDERTDEDDLVVGISSREGGISWNEELRTLPSKFVDLTPHSFVMVYPREGEPEYDAKFLKID